MTNFPINRVKRVAHKGAGSGQERFSYSTQSLIHNKRTKMRVSLVQVYRKSGLDNGNLTKGEIKKNGQTTTQRSERKRERWSGPQLK